MKRVVLALLLLAAAPLSADTKLIYDFESGTEGFNGKTATAPIGATHGKMALELDTAGSVGWKQDIALLTENADWTDAVELLMDVYLPAGTKDAAEYVQLVPVFSGPADSWYMPYKADLKDGANQLRIRIDGAAHIQTPTKFYLVVNSGKAIPGKIYVDNIRMHTPSKPGKLTVRLKDKAGRPVAGAVLACGKTAVTSDAQGVAVIELPGDDYPAEVLGTVVTSMQFTAAVPSGGEAVKDLVVERAHFQPAKAVRAWVQAEKPGIPFEAHKVYGHNMAMWSGLDPFTSDVQRKKLQAIHCEMIRVPGGEYGNQWDWNTGSIHKQDETAALDWSPEANWNVWKKWLTDMGPNTEALLILNVFQRTPEDQVAWIKDAIDSGIKVRYVELGNEPDLDPNRFFGGVKGGSTDVATYVKVVTPFARAVRAAFPNIKILGPVTAQIDDHECPGKQPWLCNNYSATGELMDDPLHEDWIKKFLRLYAQQGDLLDGLSVHSYPYYPRWLGQTTDVWDAPQAFSKVANLTKYMAKYRGWMKEFYPAKAAKMDIAMTEYHMQVAETWVTADVESAAFLANYLAEFIKGGGTLATAWDINTLKVGDGGGHGMLDPTNDPNDPYAERAKYWVFKMLANNFTGTMVPAQSSDPNVAVYGAKDRQRVTTLLVNRSADTPAVVNIQVSGAPGATKLRLLTLNHRGYQWSKVLYRAVVNEDPTAGKNQKIYGAPAERQGWRVVPVTLDPMSVTMAVLE